MSLGQGRPDPLCADEAVKVYDSEQTFGKLHRALNCHEWSRIDAMHIDLASKKPQLAICDAHTREPPTSTSSRRDIHIVHDVRCEVAQAQEAMKTLTFESRNELNGHLAGSFFRLFFTDILPNLQVINAAYR